MKLSWLLLFGFILSGQYGFSQDWKVFPYQPPGSKITFPTDEGRHTAEPIEWWYASGNLTGKISGKAYTFMLTYFYYPAAGFEGFRILNVMEESTGIFYIDTRPVNYTKLSTTQLDIEAIVYGGGKESWSSQTRAQNTLDPFVYALKAFSSKVSLDINVVAKKRPLLLDEDGYLEQGSNNYSYYYSLTRNEVNGNLTLNGITEPVSGVSWIDRQYGNYNPLTAEKYEWFHVQLSNGMDLNLWNIFTTENTIPDTKKYRILAAYVDENSQYTTSDFTIDRLAFNYMPDSLRCYASKWRVKSAKNKLDLTITTKHSNAEVAWPFRFYEGATEVKGSVNGLAVSGFGFAELLHHYEKPQVSFIEPAGETYNTSKPIRWRLLNHDEGRGLTYDLLYSIDNRVTYHPVVEGLSDTFYLWTDPAIKNGDMIWFQLRAKSVDNTLSGTAISGQAMRVIRAIPGRQKIRLYPNPARDLLFIEPSFQMNNPAARILDANGSVLREFKSNSISNSIEVHFLRPGVYFIQIDKAVGKRALKFVKE